MFRPLGGVARTPPLTTLQHGVTSWVSDLEVSHVLCY